MNTVTTMKRTAQTVVLVSALALTGIAQAQYGNNSGSSTSSNSNSSTNSGQSSQKPKSSYDQSNAVDKGEQREKMERDVKDTIKRDKAHELNPGNFSPPK